MSVLVLDEEPVVHRHCEERYLYGLQDWFAWVEMNAWERVNAYYESARPKEIFLVTGQYLSSSYAVAHKSFGSLACDVVLESNIQIPTVIEGSPCASFAITKAYVEAGFEYVISSSGAGTPTQYSIILDAYKPKSGPLQRLQIG